MFSFISPLVAGVALGALFVNLVAIPAVCVPGVERGSRRLLRIGIVLLGLRLSLGDLAALGVRGLGVVAVVVVVTFFGTQWLARKLGVPKDLGLLVATGYSICGASAIAAMDGVVGADEEETAYAITLVTLCGTLAIFVLPLLGGPLGLSGEAFGSWVGGSVHDVGQVIATASHGGSAARRRGHGRQADSHRAARATRRRRGDQPAPRQRSRRRDGVDHRAAPDPAAVRVRVPDRHRGALDRRAVGARRCTWPARWRRWC